ncbi:hypothetical protein SEA_GEAZY_35 [Gordonia phage GEazy]|nr:hypothetical protein SEA_GEAZY_35 [Gordonia phage GEazy]QDF16746.1 hypothetical protein SEA_HANNAHD_33 [Gordonia phage HannahD]
MIITGAFLAENVIGNDGKFYVWGGAVTEWGRPPGASVSIPLVLLLQAEPGDTTTSLPGELFTPDDSSHELRFDVPPAALEGTDVGWLYVSINLGPENPDGRYVILVGDVSLPVRLITRP